MEILFSLGWIEDFLWEPLFSQINYCFFNGKISMEASIEPGWNFPHWKPVCSWTGETSFQSGWLDYYDFGNLHLSRMNRRQAKWKLSQMEISIHQGLIHAFRMQISIPPIFPHGNLYAFPKEISIQPGWTEALPTETSTKPDWTEPFPNGNTYSAGLNRSFPSENFYLVRLNRSWIEAFWRIESLFNQDQ